jgi:hypothetical protein
MSSTRTLFTARKSLIVAALLVAATAASHAAGGSGETLGIDMVAPPPAAEPLTRAQVKEELRQAREAGLLVVSGELTDSDAVLAARERFNVAQAEEIMAAYRAEAAQAAHAAALAEAAAAQQAVAPSSDPNANLSLEFLGGDAATAALFVPHGAQLKPAGDRWLSAQLALNAEHPASMLIVTLPGGDGALQQRRAHVLRQRLGVLGVAPEQVYFEAGRARGA